MSRVALDMNRIVARVMEAAWNDDPERVREELWTLYDRSYREGYTDCEEDHTEENYEDE